MLAALMALALPSAALAANPVQVENARPGSSAWDIPTLTPGSLEGYSDRISALPGETVNLRVSSDESASYRVEVYRLGWYGGTGGRLMTCLPSCNGSKTATAQPYPVPDPTTGMVKANWTTTETFTVGSDWVSGYYIALLRKLSGPETGSGFTIPLVVKAPPEREKVMLVQASANTWQAYNRWGGKSLYNSNSVDSLRATHVSYDRPFHRETQGLYHYDVPLARFLEREGFDVAYQADTDTDQDPTGLLGYRMVASAGHDEYWSKTMRDAFENARDAGVNLAFFGANTGYWQVRHADGGRTIVAYKDRSADPEPDQRLKTIQFRVLIPPRPECQLLGVQYQGGALSSGDAAGYRAYSAVPSSLGDSWLTGTGLTAGSSIPTIVGYEWDSIDPSCAVPGTVTPLLQYDGGSLTETAHAVRYTAPSGAKVFSAGTLNWSWKLDSFVLPGYDTTGHGEDERIQTLTRNLVTDQLQPRPANFPPTANFTRDVAAPVAGQTVTFTDTSTDIDGTIAARAWDLDDDGVYDDGTGATAAGTFAPAGSSTVSLRVTDDKGATATRAMTFAVSAGNVPPAASFTQNKAAPLAGDTVTFTDTSTDSDGTIASRAWDLNGDGQYDDGTGATADRTFTLAGSYTVGLRVTDDDGATATKTVTVAVSAAPGQWSTLQHRGLFSSATSTTMALAPTSPLTSGSLVVVAVGWADQTSTPTVTDTRGNTYAPAGPAARYAGSRSVQLFYAKGVTGGATTVTVTFSSAVDGRFMGISEYAGLDTATPLVATATASGNGTSGGAPVAASAAGQLVVGITQNGAGGVAGVLGASPSLLDTGAGGSTGHAMDATSAAGPSTLRFRFNASGSWAVASAAFRVHMNAAPTASFTRTPLVPVAGQSVTFTDTSTDSDGTIASRAWDLDDDGAFDDGTGATATRTFPTAGMHTVRLSVTDNSGAITTSTMNFAVDPVPNVLPAASFTHSPASPSTGEPVVFTDTSTDSDGTIVSRDWDLDDDGAFDDGSFDGNNAVESTVFVTAGPHDVHLRVTDNSGATDVETVTINVLQGNVAPAASIRRDLRVPRVGETVVFTDTSTDSDGTVAARAWDLDGDGAYDDGNGQTAARAFDEPSINTVRLRVTDDDGAVSVAEMIFAVYASGNIAPQASFEADDAAPSAGDTVTFTDTSTDPDGSIALRAWDLDDDGQYDDGTGATAARLFAIAGSYTVGLKVTDNGGAATTTTATVTVIAANVLPTASFTQSNAAPVAGDTVTFTDTSTDSDGTIASRAWDLNGDGQYDDGTGAGADRTFASAGTFTVGLRVTDNRGGTATTTASVTVIAANVLPTASFTQSNAAPVAGDSVTFTDTSTDSDGTITARAWDLNGDGQYDDGTGASANRTFATAGTSTVGLRVTDNRGGTATTTASVTVIAANVLPTASFSQSKATPVAGDTVTFTDTSTDSDGTITSRAWDLNGDGQYDDGTGTRADRTFATAGTSTIGLRVTDNRGGTATTTRSITIASWSSVQNRAQFSSGSATTIGVTPAGALTTGDLVVVAVAWGDQSSTAAVTDTRGNTYTPIGSPVPYAGSRRVQLFYARNAIGGTATVTATFSAAVGNRWIAVAEFSGMDPISPLVTSAFGSSSGSSSSVPVNATAPGQLLVGATVNGAGGIANVTGSSAHLLDTAPGASMGDAFGTTAAAGPSAITFGYAASGPWASTVAAFRPAGT